MTLYFDYKVQSSDPLAVNFSLSWHSEQLFLAVASYSQNRGGYVSLFDELGELLQDINDAQHPVVQVTALRWHPQKKILVTGWENGEIRVWLGDKSMTRISSPHQAPITIIQWSSQGSRLVSADAVGGVVGWKVDQQGNFSSVFHLDVKEPLLCIVFRTNVPRQGVLDINGLAKAAVNGDETALDMFSAWRPRTAGNRFAFTPGKIDNLCFYAGSVGGAVFYVTESGECSQVLASDDGAMINKVLYREGKEQLVFLNECLGIAQYDVQPDGTLTEVTKLKLTGRASAAYMSWAGPSLIAVTTGDLAIRCWDLDSGDSELVEATSTSQHPEEFTCLTYCSVKGLLCGGTNNGNIMMWRWDKDTGTWTNQMPCQLRGTIKQLNWGTSLPLLAVNTINGVLIMREQQPCMHFGQSVSAVQVSPCQLTVDTAEHSMVLKTDQQAVGVTVSSEHVCVWSTKTMVIYQIDTEGIGLDAKLSAKVVGSFPCQVHGAVIDEQNLVVVEETVVNVRNLQGTVKQSLELSESEGQPMTCDLCGHFVTVATTAGYIKVWDLSRREAKPHWTSKELRGVVDDFSEVMYAKCNSNGTKVSFTVAKADYLPDTKLFLWSLDADRPRYLDVETGLIDTGEVLQDKKDDVVIENRFILSHYWDTTEPRLMACEAKLLPKSLMNTGIVSRKIEEEVPIAGAAVDKMVKSPVLLIGLFTSSDLAFIVQDVLASDEGRLIGVEVPHYILLDKMADSKSMVAGRQLMKDFHGLEGCDADTKMAVMEFSYSMSVGSMDSAFKAIRNIENEAVWTSLARMCVKTQRLDVAYICLGHMQHVRGIRALRMSENEPELEARVAMLAIQLGMPDQAERLYVACKRYDLLNKLYQARGQWGKAVELATSLDRIHLRSTYHAYGASLEADGDLNEAIKMYEKADTHVTEVPRMLADSPQLLETYIMRDKQPQLVKWWGQYMESANKLEEAADLYQQSDDHLSLVRVLCFQGQLSEAAEVATASNDKPACYHVARQYEVTDNVQEAVNFFVKAEAYSNAVRLCKDNGMEDQLWDTALLASKRQQLEAAKHFENQEMYEKAVVLYHRAGNIHKAVELAFRSEQYDTLYAIAADLKASSDPALVQKCAEFFTKDKHYDKAIQLLALNQQFDEAMTLCEEHHVTMTDSLAEQLTAAKTDADQSQRARILERVAESALDQGNYHLATKKYTQAGNKVKAMKALLKSGDTEKIIFFANVSRQREIYIMAANYLQSLDWQAQPYVLKTIVTFYSKGKSLDLLANFYVACAQLEVDEYQNYEKALGALEEAHRCLNKDATHRNQPQHSKALENLNGRISLVKRFVDIRKQWSRGDRDAAFGQCRQLLQNPTEPLELAVRRGDIYTLMVQHRVDKEDYAAAYQLIQEFQKAVTNVDVYLYLGNTLLEKVAKELNITFEKPDHSPSQEVEEEEEEVMEDYQYEK